MVRVAELSKYFADYTAVDHISFTLERGKIYGLLGPNGAGKSTTIKMLTGCLFPSEGSIRIAGYDLLREPEHAKRHFGYLPERLPVYPTMTPREYLTFMAQLKNLPRNKRAAQIDEVMEKTHITSVSNQLIHQLSKGYQQRVGIAQALLGAPDLLILDEPMTGLDPTQIVEIRNTIKELGKNHTVLFSSHILSEVGMICSQILLLKAGRLIANDKIENIQRIAKRHEVLTVTVACEPAAAKAVLCGMDEVEHFEFLADEEGSTVQFYYSNGADIQCKIFQRFQQKGIQIVRLSSQKASLEESFLSLLSREEGRQRASGEEGGKT